ncbi:MAG: flagellar hook-basal body complex protein FliE [Myxococcota bacterium]|jgi:flagellar hook-basal body complex protein FliE|nr:flagellar hook-basal body complex protein FliE [Myxococcota bacterium]
MPIITGVASGPEISLPQLSLADKEVAAPGFSDQLLEFVKKSNEELKTGEVESLKFASGETNNIHETMLAAERANIALRLVGSIRNRLLETYQEIMRMPV